jgi:hypothetical protein
MSGIFQAMGRLFGQPQRSSAANSSIGPSSVHSQTHIHSGMSQMAPSDSKPQVIVHRDVLRLVLRDMLSRHGIPSAWLGLQVLSAKSAGKDKGLHARFIVKHWEPRLLAHAPGLERSFIERLMALDPLADQWLMGLSWQLQLAPDFVPEQLPRAGAWTGPNKAAAPARSRPAPLMGGSADVIAGPVRIGGAPAQGDTAGREGLERLLALNDQQQKPGSYDATRPAKL